MPTFSSSFWTQLPFLQDSAKRAGGGGSSLRTHSCDVIASIYVGALTPPTPAPHPTPSGALLGETVHCLRRPDRLRDSVQAFD